MSLSTAKVYIQEPWGDQSRAMFKARGFTIVDTPEECDIIVFNGGEDLHPKLYGQTVLPKAGLWLATDDRDDIELKGYERAKDKFKFGICRGGQLLTVMNGGKLWQDVDGHNRGHHMIDIKSGRSVYTSSVHHQMFMPGPDCEIIAVARVAESKYGIVNGTDRPLLWRRSDWVGEPTMYDDDVEVCYYPKDRALCIQGHPEYPGYGDFTNYCFEQLERLYGS